MLPGLLIALAVAWGDMSFADCQRSMARIIDAGFSNYPYQVWFQGHWGFQYYMEKHGARPLDYKNSLIGAEDIIVIPKTNTGQVKLPSDRFTFAEKLECRPLSWVSTMSKKNRACYYSITNTGTKLYLPFAFGDVDPEEYYLFIVGKIPRPKAFLLNHHVRF